MNQQVPGGLGRTILFAKHAEWAFISAVIMSVALPFSCELWNPPQRVLAAEADAAEGDSQPISLAERRAALLNAVTTNTDYAEEWLSGGDFKTLGQTADGMNFLADCLAWLGDPELRKLSGTLRSDVRALESAANAKDKVAAEKALVVIRAWSKTAAETKFAKVARPVPMQPPNVGIGPMMALLDGTYADAKRALIFDDIPAAKQQAIVLAELGGLLIHARGGGNWERLAEDFRNAAWKVATSEENTAASVRMLLGGVYQKCTACHDRR